MNRWFRVVGGVLMNLSLGAVYAWSLFVAPLEQEFGWSRTDTSLVFTITIVAAATGFIVGGWIQDKKGPLLVSLLGSGLFSLGLILSRFTSSLPELYLYFGIVAGVGSGLGYVTPIAVAGKWFPDRRGLVVGIMVAGYAAGSAVLGLPFIGPRMITSLGWRDSFLWLGLVYFVATFIASLLLRNPPPDYKLKNSVSAQGSQAAATTIDFSPAEMLRTRQFYRMWISYALGAAAGLMVISQLIPFSRAALAAGGLATETIAGFATAALIIGAAGNVAGRIFSGLISDFTGRTRMLMAMMLLSCVAMFFLPRAESVTGLYAGIIVVYYCYGTLLSLFASTTIDFFGTRNSGANCGCVFTAWGIAGVIGPWIGGTLFDQYHNYDIAFVTGSALSLAAAILIATVSAPMQTEAGQMAQGGNDT